MKKVFNVNKIKCLDCLKAERSHLDEIINIVNADESSEFECDNYLLCQLVNKKYCLKFFCEIIKNQSIIKDGHRVYCPIAQSISTENTQLMVGPGRDASGYKELRDFSCGANDIIVIDPYFYSEKKENSVEYIDHLKKALRIGFIKRLHVIYSNNDIYRTRSVYSSFKKECSENKCLYTDKRTDKIHDRIWIADRKRAIVVGTSFNGIGNQLSFILVLPVDDLKSLLEFIDNSGLSRK